MSAYLLVSTRVIRQDGWLPYQSQVGACFARFGGTYVVRRCVPTVLEGRSPHDRITLFEFPSLQAIHDLWNSPEYAALKPLRAGLGELDVIALDGAPH